MVMADFNNNSVFTYNLQQTEDIDQFSLEVFNGNDSKSIDTANFKYSSENFIVANFTQAISEVANHSKTVNTIELALETTRLANTILSKINL
jgi:hypothetical protein